MIPLDLVRDLGRRYPGAWEALEAFRAARARGSIPHWPSWCWCPLAGSYAVATGGSDDRLPQGNAVAEIGAVAAWRASQGIYRIHPDLVDELTETPLEEIPAEWLYQLPEWCVWIDIEDGGFFAHLESDATTGRPELRLWVVPPAPDKPYPIVVHLDRPTIAAGIAAAIDEARTQAARAWSQFTPPESVVEHLRRRAGVHIALVAYLIGAVRDGDVHDAKGGPGRPTPSHATPNHPTTWEVGWKQGAAFAAARAAAEQGGEHAGPRPHLRRAHWHHFWEGPRSGERRLVVRWMPPIFVGSGEIIPTIHDLGDHHAAP